MSAELGTGAGSGLFRRLFVIVVAAGIVAANPASAFGHTGQSSATPSNAGKGHPWTSNGCTWSPDAIPGVLNFKHACDHHDGCYIGFPQSKSSKAKATYWVSRSQCDTWFHSDMRASCREQHQGRLKIPSLNYCFLRALDYYTAVRIAGWAWYKKPEYVQLGYVPPVTPPPVAPPPPPLPPPPPGPGPGPPPPVTPAVSLSKGGSAQGQPGCSSPACSFMTVTFSNFSAENHTITCRASNGDEAGFYTYTRPGSSNTSSVCYYGFPGQTAWVTVDGVMSNQIVW